MIALGYFGMWGAEGGGRLQYVISIQEGSMEIHMRENCVLFLPVNILTMWCTSFLGCTTHYHVSYMNFRLSLYGDCARTKV